MEFRSISALRGPNIWANFSVLEAEVDLGELKDRSSEQIPGFNDRLQGWLPSLVEHRCSVGQRGGFFQRLARGTYLAHILEHVTLEIQTLAGTPAGFGKARETDEDGVYKVVLKYEEEEVARACLEFGRRLCLAAVYDRPVDVDAEIKRLRGLCYDIRLGPSTGAIARAARARGIPVQRLNRESLLQLGYGARQRRICAAESDRTPAIAEAIAQDKELTRSLLRSIGVPVPEGRPVADADDAWAAAQELAGPVVVKPQFGNHGRGVATNLTSQRQVAAAYAAAREEGRAIIVERYIPGEDHRLLVIGGRLVAAALREPAHVIGDGRSTIAQLVEQVNRDPRRSDGHATALSFVKLDTIGLAVLADHGFGPESVPPAGLKVLIRRNGNLSTGGTATDVTERVHPQVAARAVDAARVIGLDIAGVDILATDIGRPMEEQNAAVVEVNAGPGLRMHLEPSAGTPRPVAEAIVELLYGPGETGRIPIVAVTGDRGADDVARLVAQFLGRAGRTVGLTCADGALVGQQRIPRPIGAAPHTAMLLNPRVEAAVLEISAAAILREGLGVDYCDVGVVTALGEGRESHERLIRAQRTVVEAVPAGGMAVLNAEDPQVAAMAEFCRAAVTWFARDPNQTVVVEHRRNGGRAVVVRGETIVLADGEREQPLSALAGVPAAHEGPAGFEIQSTLAAVAAAWGLGISPEAICGG